MVDLETTTAKFREQTRRICQLKQKLLLVCRDLGVANDKLSIDCERTATFSVKVNQQTSLLAELETLLRSTKEALQADNAHTNIAGTSYSSLKVGADRLLDCINILQTNANVWLQVLLHLFHVVPETLPTSLFADVSKQDDKFVP